MRAFFIGVLDIEVEVAFLDFFNGNFPRVLAFLALGPPVGDGVEVFALDGFGFRIGFLALDDVVLVVPDFLGGFAFGKEEEVGADGGVRAKYATGQARTMVCRLQSVRSFSLMRVLTPSPKREPSGNTTAARPPSRRRVMMSTRKRSAVSRV